MYALTTMGNLIELKINFGDILSVVIALLALLYTIHSTRDSQRKSVLPYLTLEQIGSTVKVDGIGTSATVVDATSDYKVRVTKNKELKGIEVWGEEERRLILNKKSEGKGVWSYGSINFPRSFKLINTGKNTAISFSLIVGNKSTYAKNIAVNEEKIISVLLEDENSTFYLLIKFKDIYGNQYKEKIEFYKGRMFLHLDLKRVGFSKTKGLLMKWESRLKIRKQARNQKNKLDK
ncbi:hypothetical protein B9W73_06990 [Lactococcus lactis]|uniref:hypothetical protein n=1 Tax=Lactococcus lactis TaxID=1358 RepID=UPI000A1DCAAB|nr:hypothetical protein [Lactococcus lactis]OSP86997.1 hypothetical protein B9W73_06990 [Lactococcus lactis]